MSEPLVQAASRLAECCALLAIGYNLKQSGLLRSSDGETAIKVATTLTLPSVIVQALGSGGHLGGDAVSLLGVAAVCMGAQLAATWLYCMHRPVRERAVLAGSCTGLSLRLFGYPVVDCFLGGRAAGATTALQSVALLDVVNHLAVWVGAYMLFAGAGPAFPESFKHEDGGDYRGQWRGMRKEGLGVYTYSSGARYEGEWRNNLKEGRGVYYFPKGGVYEGEWSAGTMNGLGVRTFSSGQFKAGRWRDGQLEAPLELWQVALASDGATAVAAAARRVEVGGGRLVDAAHALLAQPTLWALAAGLALNLARVPLPTSLDLITGVLAQANTPLMLMAAGITAPPLALPKFPGLQQLLPDIGRLLGARLLVPLAVASNLLALLAAGSDGGAFHIATATLLPLAATLVALLAPLPPEARANARRFRLNEPTAAAVTTVSYFVCVPLMMLAGVAACASNLAALPAAAAAIVDVRPLAAFAVAAMVTVSAAVGYATRQWSPSARLSPPLPTAEDQRVRMVYVGRPADGATRGSLSSSSSSSMDAESSGPASTATTVRRAEAMGTGSSATSSSQSSSGTGSSATSSSQSSSSTSPSRGTADGGGGGSGGGDVSETDAGGAGPSGAGDAGVRLPPGNATGAAGVTGPSMAGAASCWSRALWTSRGVWKGMAASRWTTCTAASTFAAAAATRSHHSSMIACSALAIGGGGGCRECGAGPLAGFKGRGGAHGRRPFVALASAAARRSGGGRQNVGLMALGRQPASHPGSPLLQRSPAARARGALVK